MSQEPQRYEGIIEDRTVEVVMESSYVLEALRAPVFVDDLGTSAPWAGHCWRPGGNGSQVLVWRYRSALAPKRWNSSVPWGSWCSGSPEPQTTTSMSVSREGIAAIKDGEDPWDAYMLAVTRASWLWGLEARKMTKSDHQLKALLTGEPQSSQTRGASPAASEVEEAAAATSENQNTQGRRDRTLPDIPGFPSKAKYQVSSGIDLDLTSGRTTYQL